MFLGKRHPDLSVQLNPYSALTSRVLHGQDAPPACSDRSSVVRRGRGEIQMTPLSGNATVLAATMRLLACLSYVFLVPRAPAWRSECVAMVA